MRIHYAMGALDKSIRLRAAAAKNPAPKSNPPKLGAAASRHAREYATMLIDRFDTNRDGKLTREEARKAAWQNAESTWFMEDANNDDRVSWQELHDAFARLARKFQSTNSRPPYVSSKNAWQKCDTNRDGQVDRKEARNSVEHPAAEQFFFRGDLDGNDRLTLNELNIHFGFVAHQKWASVRQSLATKTKISQVRAVETMIIEKFDTNRDGALTLNEIKKMPWPRSEQTFTHCDLNRDGKVTITELSDTLDLVYRRTSRQRQEMPDRFAVSNWKQFDRDRDGSIDRAESNRTPYDNVADWFRSDLNGDGQLSLSEMNLSFNIVALDKSIRMQQAVEKKYAPPKPADPAATGILGTLKNRLQDNRLQDTIREKVRREAAAHYATLILNRFDLNKDGRIDRAEARKAPWPKSEQVWFQGSRKRDETIDAAELRAQFEILQGVLETSGQQNTRSHTNWLLKVVDRNGDGHIDKAETQLTSWPNAGNNWFKGDANADGKVNYDELLVAMAMNAQDKGVRLAEAELERLNSGRKAQP